MLPDFELCCSEFSAAGIELNMEQYKKFDKYAKILVDYNANVNLTAITQPEEILVKHFIDSTLLLKYVDFPQNSSVIDVGTGAGFPSIPMKIMRNDLKITLLDSLSKRIVFLEKLCENLDLDSEFVHGRAEDIGKLTNYREKFDFSVARAVAELAVLSEYCVPFVKVGGSFLSMKGPSEDVNKAKTAINLLGGEVFKVHEYSLKSDSRKIIQIKKISQTPTKFPRNSSQIKKKSL